MHGPGTHKLRWSIFTKSDTDGVSGTLALIVPVDPDRPPFRRLEGILRYPDVDIIDEAGTVVHERRGSDPPLSPPHQAETSGIPERLRSRFVLNAWDALGLSETEPTD